MFSVMNSVQVKVSRAQHDFVFYVRTHVSFCTGVFCYFFVPFNVWNDCGICRLKKGTPKNTGNREKANIEQNKTNKYGRY